jgi:hypothetical protein
LTHDGYVNFAVWTRDSKDVVYGWAKSGLTNIFMQPIDQRTPAAPLTAEDAGSGQGPGAWSRDGHLLAFWRQDPDKASTILILDARSHTTTPFLKAPAGTLLMGPEFSPHGDWLAYASSESDRQEVWLAAFPRGEKLQVSNGGGGDPLWSKDGKRPFYRFRGRAWAVDIDTAGALKAGKPQLLFTNADRYYQVGPGRTWDLSSDGRRFLMVRLEETKRQPITRMVLVQNWTAVLARLIRGQRP